MNGLRPSRETLRDGIVVLAKEARTIPAVTINLAMRAGSICDPPDSPGAIHLLSRVIDRGTATRTADEIAEQLDSHGITLTTAVTRHVLSLVCTCLTDHFHEIFALLGDVIVSASFPDGEVAKRKTEAATQIRQDEDNPGVRAVETLMELLYKDRHPYGRRTKGTVEVVERLTGTDLCGLHRRRFAPSELSVVVVGDVPAARVIDTASRVFEGWRTPPPPAVTLPKVNPTQDRTRVVIPMMNKVQADVAYGFLAVARSDPSYYAYWLMNNVLGQYSMGGRLGDSIRERQGMAYYAFSSLDANVVEGPLTIRAGVSAANVDRTVSSIDDEIARFVRDGVTEKEITESKQYLIGSMPRALETNAGIATFLQNAEFFGLGLDYDLRLPGLLQAVTRADIHEAARRVLDPARATVVIAGPYAEG